MLPTRLCSCRRLQPVLHVALCIVPPAQLVPLGAHRLVGQMLQQMIQQPSVPYQHKQTISFAPNHNSRCQIKHEYNRELLHNDDGVSSPPIVLRASSRSAGLSTQASGEVACITRRLCTRLATAPSYLSLLHLHLSHILSDTSQRGKHDLLCYRA